MSNITQRVPSVSDVLKKISDDKALTLFNSIAVSNGDRYPPLKEMNLTTKQYYSRIAGLVDVGLIKRNNGKYFSYTNGKGSLSITNVNRQDTFLLLEAKGN